MGALDPTIKFVLVDFTTDITPAALRPAQVFDRLIAALLEQTTNDYGPEHGAPCVQFRVAASPVDRGATEIAINFRDTLAVDGALAFHEVTNGVPDIEIGCDLFSSLSTGNESMTQGASHEYLETLRDMGANEWADKQDGSGQTEAQEVADPVQNTFYNASNGIALSNFVRRSYFIPGSVGPWDFQGVMQSQNDITHGYAIRATAPTDVSQVQGRRGFGATHAVTLHGAEKLTENQRKRKSSPYSRSHRRGVRL